MQTGFNDFSESPRLLTSVQIAYSLRVNRHTVAKVIKNKNIAFKELSPTRGFLYSVLEVLQAMDLTVDEYLKRRDCVDTQEAVALLNDPKISNAKDLINAGFRRYRPGTTRFYWSKKELLASKIAEKRPLPVPKQMDLIPEKHKALDLERIYGVLSSLQEKVDEIMDEIQTLNARINRDSFSSPVVPFYKTQSNKARW